MADVLPFEASKEQKLKRELEEAKKLRKKSFNAFLGIFKNIPQALKQIRLAHLHVQKAKAEIYMIELGRELARRKGREKELEGKLAEARAEYKRLTGKDLKTK